MATWTSLSDATVLFRRLREYAVKLRTDVDDVQQALQTARDIVLALRAEVVAARDGQATLADRLAVIEARLTALETPTP